ncbi:MAG: hypothetical protein H6Q72_1500 [Firmicutes bacterium]|nr:hypothetical protein [Bacillota bacterium]
MCVACNIRQAREGRKLCRTCETDKYMIEKYYQFRTTFDNDKSRLGVLIKDFISYLDNSYGDQKREIAYRIRYTVEAFETEAITLKDKWSINDIIQIEKYRATLSVQKRTALYHFVEFLKDKYALNNASEELRIKAVIDDIPDEFKIIVESYLEFLRTYRKYKYYTRFQLAYSLKYLFNFLKKTFHIIDTRQVSSDHIKAYLNYLLSMNSQKNAYTRLQEASNFFKWARKDKLAFSNPCSGIKLSYGNELTQPLDEQKQANLLKRWLDDEGDPREALVGILSLIYACSREELRYLPYNCIVGDKIIIPGRPINIKLTPIIENIFKRYLSWRETKCKGAHNDYLIISRISYKRNQPVGPEVIGYLLKEIGINVRKLRSTRFHDIARSGHLKLLEGLGLSFMGTQPYIQAAAPVLLMNIDILEPEKSR